MIRRTIKIWLVGLACAGIPLTTAVSCDPTTGAVKFYRDDDDGDYYYDDGYYYDYGYYGDYGYYYDDCYYGCY